MKLGGIHFSSKAKAKNYVKDLLKNNDVSDQDLLKDVFKMHYAYIHPNLEYEGQIVNLDNAVISIREFYEGRFKSYAFYIDDLCLSYNTCFAPEKTKIKFSANAEMRNIIYNQTNRYRQQRIVNGKITCEITGVEYDSDEIEIDHNNSLEGKTFNELVNRFFDETEYSYDDFINSKKYEMLNTWSAFHERECNLRAIHKSFNL